MSVEIRLAILEDHESIIDGYRYRLQDTQSIQVSATANFANDLLPLLKQHKVDVLLMDVHVPVSEDNPNPYPILQLIPQLQCHYPKLVVIVISAHNRAELVDAVLKAGARGFIYKSDHGAIQNLGRIILAVAQGMHFRSKPTPGQESVAVPKLTARQLEILSLFSAEPDLTAVMVANRLNISHSTVRNQLSKAYERLGVQNLTAAIEKMRALGILIYPEAPFESPTS